MFHLFPSRTVAFDLFGFGVHWYGLMYFAAFIIAWFLLPHLQKLRKLSLTPDQWSSLISAAVIGVIVGGRLGYVLFYGPVYYAQHPLEIFAIWNGGMASHGGFIGVMIALLIVLRGHKVDEILRIGDVIVIPVAIGLGLGRIGNFINQELYGTVTTLPWGVMFDGVVGKRHPIQFYDFTLMMMIALSCFFVLRSPSFQKPGRVGTLFLILYSIVRFLIEFIREQNGVFFWGLSEGQWLTIPLFLFACWLWRWTGRRNGEVRMEKRE